MKIKFITLLMGFIAFATTVKAQETEATRLLVAFPKNRTV